MTQLVGSVTDVALVSAIAQLHGELGEPYGETELGYRVEPNSLMGPHLRPLFFFCHLRGLDTGVHIGDTNGQKGEWWEVTQTQGSCWHQ